MSSTLAFIFARGGSKGLPGKNLALLGGKPLVAWSVETALACPSVSRTIISTDDPDIAAAAVAAGAEAPFLRPSHLASDDSPEWLSFQHAIRTMRELEPALDMDTFLSLPPTAPLRNVGDVEKCLSRLAHGDCDIVTTGSTASRNPYFNMVTIGLDNLARRVCEPQSPLARRQDAPVCFDLTTVAYAARTDYILSATSLFEGKVAMVEIPKERAIDIDDQIDLELAELLLENR